MVKGHELGSDMCDRLACVTDDDDDDGVTFTGPSSSQVVNSSQNVPDRLLLSG